MGKKESEQVFKEKHEEFLEALNTRDKYCFRKGAISELEKLEKDLENIYQEVYVGETQAEMETANIVLTAVKQKIKNNLTDLKGDEEK